MSRYDEFYSRLSKDLIDRIDQVLARHFRLTAMKLDFVINYGIKFRVGVDEDTDEELHVNAAGNAAQAAAIPLALFSRP